MEKLKFKALVLPLLLLLSCSISNEKEIASIHRVLDTQVSAWNRGDLGGYMSGYWESDSLIFTSAKDITYGQKEALVRYQKRYPNKAEMGTLHFEDVSTRMLEEEVAFTVGKWILNKDSQEIVGRFTLIWQKMNGQWFIITDHSS